jgi:glycosyltransferase involved in cell wall biosynthesis
MMIFPLVFFLFNFYFLCREFFFIYFKIIYIFHITIAYLQEIDDLMKICMITDTYHPLCDGIVRYLDYLIPQLLERGHQVSVVCPWFEGTPHYEEPRDGLTIYRCFNTHHQSHGYYYSLPDQHFFRGIKNADVVILHSLMPLGMIGGLLARALRKKVALFCHHDERIILEGMLQLPYFAAGFLYGIMTAVYYRRICKILFHATKRFQQKLLDFGTPKDRLRFTPFAIDLQRFHPEPDVPLRERYTIPQDGFIACFLGRLSVEKNIRNITKGIALAMKEEPKLYGLIIGKGALQKELKKKYHHNKRFIFTGYIPESELQSHYAVSDVFVTPTRNESSCFTVYEAMACRVPVITAEKDHDPDIMHENNALLIHDVNDPFEIRDQLLYLINNPSKRKEIAFNGQRLIQERTWENHTDKFLASLQELFQEKDQKTKQILSLSAKEERPSLKERWQRFKKHLKKVN